jgi:hypothetical protein
MLPFVGGPLIPQKGKADDENVDVLMIPYYRDLSLKGNATASLPQFSLCTPTLTGSPHTQSRTPYSEVSKLYFCCNRWWGWEVQFEFKYPFPCVVSSNIRKSWGGILKNQINL